MRIKLRQGHTRPTWRKKEKENGKTQVLH